MTGVVTPTRGVRDHVSDNGHEPSSRGVTPPRRQVRLPQVAIGLLVTAGFALAALLVHLGSVNRVPVLAIGGDVDRGDVIDASDITVLHVAAEDGVNHMGRDELDRIVGRTALVDLESGTLLTSDIVADTAVLEDGEGIVGLLLDPGQFPGSGLTAGDRVHVIRAAGAEMVEGETSDDPVVARNARVTEVEELASDQRLVSIVAEEAEAVAVAAAAGGGSLRLVMVAP